MVNIPIVIVIYHWDINNGNLFLVNIPMINIYNCNQSTNSMVHYESKIIII